MQTQDVDSWVSKLLSNTCPIGSMVLLYMVTFTINIPHMLAYIPYMDPTSMGVYICKKIENYCKLSLSGQRLALRNVAALAMLETVIFWRNMLKYTPMWQNNTVNDSKPAAHINLGVLELHPTEKGAEEVQNSATSDKDSN